MAKFTHRITLAMVYRQGQQATNTDDTTTTTITSVPNQQQAADSTGEDQAMYPPKRSMLYMSTSKVRSMSPSSCNWTIRAQTHETQRAQNARRW